MFENTDATKTFTLREARGLIPRLRRLLPVAMREREALLDLRVEIERARDKADLGGGSPYGAEYLNHLAAFSNAAQQIQDMGVEVKDYKIGLVDFPHEFNGRIVYLCWRPDEDQIGWWHEIDAGYAGRQLLTDEFE